MSKSQSYYYTHQQHQFHYALVKLPVSSQQQTPIGPLDVVYTDKTSIAFRDALNQTPQLPLTVNAANQLIENYNALSNLEAYHFNNQFRIVIWRTNAADVLGTCELFDIHAFYKFYINQNSFQKPVKRNWYKHTGRRRSSSTVARHSYVHNISKIKQNTRDELNDLHDNLEYKFKTKSESRINTQLNEKTDWDLGWRRINHYTWKNQSKARHQWQRINKHVIKFN